MVMVSGFAARAPSPYVAPAINGDGLTDALKVLSAADTTGGTASARMSAAVDTRATIRDPTGREGRDTENDDIFPSGPRVTVRNGLVQRRIVPSYSPIPLSASRPVSYPVRPGTAFHRVPVRSCAAYDG